jgi:hypothetical protein
VRRVAIVGMHRSGTSLVARLCNLLGVDLGPQDQLQEPNEENPEGFWENRPLQEINKRLLAHFDGDWDRPPMLPRGWEARADFAVLRREASQLLDGLATSPEGRLVGFKDPRTSLTLEFWAAVGATDRVVNVLRDPLEVATSLQKRNEMDLDRALMLWIRYTVAVLAHAPAAHLVVHQRAFTDAERVVRDLAAYLEAPVDDDTMAAALDAVRPDLYRSRPAPPSTSPTGDLARWLYDSLVEGERPEAHLVAALDDAYNGRHLGDADGEDPQLVTAARLQEFVDANARQRDNARQRRREVERLQRELEEERLRRREQADAHAEKLANARARVEKLGAQLAAARREVEARDGKIAEVYASSTWRAGRVVVGGPAALRRRLRG